MPSTPLYNLPYPVAGDDPNVPADMQALALAVETALASIGKTPKIYTSGTVDTAVKVTHFNMCSIVVPDPGWPYYLFFSGNVTFGTFACEWTFYAQNAATSTVYSALAKAEIPGTFTTDANNNRQRNFPIVGGYTTAPITGGITIGIAAVKDAGDPGNGGTAVASPNTKVSVLVVPA